MARLASRDRTQLFVSVCAVAIGAVPARLSAAEAPAAGGVTEVDSVVVTAERRHVDIQKAPLAITVVSAQSLDASFINDVAGLNGAVPSLESTKTAGFENIVTIRGIGSETPENDLTTIPGVSLFIDGVYLVNTISLSQTLFDVDHIEILRGPQGALYGQSAIGGAINIVTRQPELGRFGGSMDFSGGNYDLTRERVELNVPIGDTLAARLSLQRYDHEGFTDDLAIAGFREDDAHNGGEKAALLWKPNGNVSATLTGQWYQAREHGQAQKNIDDPEASPWAIYQDYPAKSNLTTELYHLNLQYDLGAFSLRSVSAYQGLSSGLREDSSRSAISLIGAYDDVAAWNTTVHSYTEEFDILSKPGARLEWIVGAFALKQSSRQFVAEFEGRTTTPGPDVNVPPDVETSPPPGLDYGDDSRVSRRSESLFTQATYHLTPTFRLTGGVRYNHDSYVDDVHDFSNVPFVGVSLSDLQNRSSDTLATWRAEADYDATPSSMIYASAARGYKPTGVNGHTDQTFVVNGATIDLIPASFAPETNTAFEIGAKNFLFDRSLRLNLAGFYYLYRNMQYIEYSPIPFASGIANIPDVHIYGVEAEAAYTGAGDRLHVNGQLSLEKGAVRGDTLSIDSTLANAIENNPSPTGPCANGGAYGNPACWAAVIESARNIGGNAPPAMPSVSGAIDAAYRLDLPMGSLTPRVEIVYRGGEWARIFNEPSLDRIPAYTLTNFNLEFVPNHSRLRIDATMTNAFNAAGINSQYTDPYGTGQTSRQFIPPRQYILSVAYAF